MASIVHQRRAELESLGEYVVLANISSGWFAVFENTLLERRQAASRGGRTGSNLIVYRTLNEANDPRDHYVIPSSIFASLLTDNTVAHARASTSRRWNLTLRDNRLRVTHGNGSLDVAPYHGEYLLGEMEPAFTPSQSSPAAPFLAAAALEGIAKELRFTIRSRSRPLREAALAASNGVCEACGVDYSRFFGGLGMAVLQVHHKKQLAKQEEAVVTGLSDLAVVCANCHALIHSNKDSAMEVSALSSLWGRSRGDTNQS
jgi:hypothetical protein